MAICEQCYHFDVCKNATIPNPEYKGEPEDKSKTCWNFVPRVDVVEVKHGEWLMEFEPNMNLYCFHCSVCDNEFSRINRISKSNYCPDCGAKMGGGNQNDL